MFNRLRYMKEVVMQKNPHKTAQGKKQAEADPVPAVNPRLSRAERYAMGKRLRETCPRTSHALWKAPVRRTDAVKLTLAAEIGRLPELLPLRHGRMVASPFTFYRGSAGIMAADLAGTPVSGVRVQACGDAHLSNFGGFATPERQVIFSINDLDETLPAPWEWDAKRLAASFVVACRDNGLSESSARDAALNCARSYREHMAEFSDMKALELWYYALDSERMIATIKDPAFRRRAIARLTKESARSVAEDIFPRLAAASGESRFIRDQLPTIFHMKGHSPGEVHEGVREAFALYRETLTPAHRVLLDRYELKDAAIKVVGIGSVGTRCWVLLLMSGEKDPLFLQVKEARASVLEPYAGNSVYPNHGQRVVNGQRLMQPYSDMFLGWTEGRLGVHYYFRQLRDIKISIRVETFGAEEMNLYAQWCGQALALSHARSGDPALISGYLGKSDVFDQALAAFSIAYADQNEKDHAAFKRAISGGKVKASFDEAESA
jgi:uncharacterized protein (DUF2252 family)